MANKPTKAEYEGFKKALANPMTPQPIKDKLQSVIDQYASEYEGVGEGSDEPNPTKAPRKPRVAKTTPAKRGRKPSSTTATMSKADAYEKAKADLKAKTGKSEEECETIIEQYRELRAKAQTRKAKEEEASKENKKRLENLDKKGNLIEGTTEKTADAVIQTTTKDVAEKIEKEIEAIELKAEKEAKVEVAKDKTLKTPKAKKDAVEERVEEKVAQKTKTIVKRVVIDTSALLTSIATTLGKFDKDSQKEFLIKLRSDIDKLLTKYAFGGMTNGAVQPMNIQQSNLSSSSVNPSQFAKGGGVERIATIDFTEDELRAILFAILWSKLKALEILQDAGKIDSPLADNMFSGIDKLQDNLDNLRNKYREELRTSRQFANGGGVEDKIKVTKLDKVVQHYDGKTWELDKYPAYTGGSAKEWINKYPLDLEDAKALVFELAGDEAYDYEDEINDAKDFDELKEILWENDFKNYQRDNTYNQSWWGGAVEWSALTENGDAYDRALVFVELHQGGDVRGNYGETKAFELEPLADEFPPYLARLTYYLDTPEGTLTLDTEDMEGYTLVVVEDQTGTYEEGDYVKLDELEKRFDLEGNSFYAQGGSIKDVIVYDNAGESFDRYTIFTPDGSVYGMSENANMPNGFNMYIGDDTEIKKGSHLGKRLKSVPKSIEKVVMNRIYETFAKGGMTEHGLRVGDEIVRDYSEFGFNEVQVRDGYNKNHVVNLDKGMRSKAFANGGGVDKLSKEDALKMAQEMGVDFNKEFHAQSYGNELAELAKKVGYRKSPSASGSLGREFFYHLQKMYDKSKMSKNSGVASMLRNRRGK